ncbi:hypothetical protein Salfasec13b_025 [Salmonella phage Salfasec13b]|nr:hypothetical protein Salfasec13b_025 [Salmonella phage Salfasec13b]
MLSGLGQKRDTQSFASACKALHVFRRWDV